MFSYTAQNEDELTFYKGSVINVISKDGEWWKGELNGEVGVFPFNYVQSLRNENEVTSQCKWSVFSYSLFRDYARPSAQCQPNTRPFYDIMIYHVKAGLHSIKFFEKF